MFFFSLFIFGFSGKEDLESWLILEEFYRELVKRMGFFLKKLEENRFFFSILAEENVLSRSLVEKFRGFFGKLGEGVEFELMGDV